MYVYCSKSKHDYFLYFSQKNHKIRKINKKFTHANFARKKEHFHTYFSSSWLLSVILYSFTLGIVKNEIECWTWASATFSMGVIFAYFLMENSIPVKNTICCTRTRIFMLTWTFFCPDGCWWVFFYGNFP